MKSRMMMRRKKRRASDWEEQLNEMDFFLCTCSEDQKIVSWTEHPLSGVWVLNDPCLLFVCVVLFVVNAL